MHITPNVLLSNSMIQVLKINLKLLTSPANGSTMLQLGRDSRTCNNTVIDSDFFYLFTISIVYYKRKLQYITKVTKS